ncbi:hypothetical protein COLO4_23108 [Corchorus olitorius]|uniref:Uncharacterized protein n=1 Tax=Corchorus olitorius TaxID=93759 RepID=A0A1R3II86_9ROSI|nr:hypothetical protein COLO4_23108 [Corchorus olitorius]
MVISVNPKEDAQQTLPERIAKLSINVKEEEKECHVSAQAASGICEGENESCRTPTGRENKIPEPLTCPPAPRAVRKRKGSSSSPSAEKDEARKIVNDQEMIEVIFCPDDHPQDSP